MTKLTEKTKNALAAAIRANTWLGTAPAELDIPDRLFDQIADDSSEAIDAAYAEIGAEATDDDMFADPVPTMLNLLLEDEIAWAEANHGKASYDDICTLAEQVAGQFTLVVVDGVNDETNVVTWGTL